MSEADVELLFRKMRWPETDGEPVCPICGTFDHWRLENQKRWKCKSCCKQFTVASGTIFAYRKMSLRDILTGIRTFILNAKGNCAIALSKELGCDYKTAFVMQHKLREALMVSMDDIRLGGEIEIDGGWFGGYIKPENTKINRVDRRLAANQNGKRRVIVGARERGLNGRAIVAVFDNEWDACAWLRERCCRTAQIYADEGAGWLDLSCLAHGRPSQSFRALRRRTGQHQPNGKPVFTAAQDRSGPPSSHRWPLLGALRQ